MINKKKSDVELKQDFYTMPSLSILRHYDTKAGNHVI